MAKQVTAEQLEVGMVFVSEPTTLNPHPEPREVMRVRTVRYAETYQVLETEGVVSRLKGDLNLMVSTSQRRPLLYTVVENVAPRDAANLVRAGIEPGTSVTIHRTADGRLWA